MAQMIQRVAESGRWSAWVEMDVEGRSYCSTGSRMGNSRLPVLYGIADPRKGNLGKEADESSQSAQ